MENLQKLAAAPAEYTEDQIQVFEQPGDYNGSLFLCLWYTQKGYSLPILFKRSTISLVGAEVGLG